MTSQSTSCAFAFIILIANHVLGAILPDYHWTFDNAEADTTYNTNSATVNSGKLLSGSSIVSSAKRYGNVAYFTGSNSGIYMDNLTSTCISNPGSCASGLSVSYWIKAINHGTEPIISSSGLLIKELMPKTTPVEIWDGAKSWLIFHKSKESIYGVWKQYTVTWNSVSLKVFVDGVMTDITNSTKPFPTFVSNSPVANRLGLGVETSLAASVSRMEMYLDDFMIWDRYLNDSQVMSVYKAGIYNADLYVLKDISDSVQMFSVNPNDPQMLPMQGTRETEVLVVTIEECFTKCAGAQNCQIVAYKPKLIGMSTCFLIENNSISIGYAKRHSGFYFYSVYRN